MIAERSAHAGRRLASVWRAAVAAGPRPRVGARGTWSTKPGASCKPRASLTAQEGVSACEAQHQTVRTGDSCPPWQRRTARGQRAAVGPSAGQGACSLCLSSARYLQSGLSPSSVGTVRSAPCPPPSRLDGHTVPRGPGRTGPRVRRDQDLGARRGVLKDRRKMLFRAVRDHPAIMKKNKTKHLAICCSRGVRGSAQSHRCLGTSRSPSRGADNRDKHPTLQMGRSRQTPRQQDVVSDSARKSGRKPETPSVEVRTRRS